MSTFLFIGQRIVYIYNASQNKTTTKLFRLFDNDPNCFALLQTAITIKMCERRVTIRFFEKKKCRPITYI